MKRLFCIFSLLIIALFCTSCMDNSVSQSEAESSLEKVLEYYYDTKDENICEYFLDNIPADVLYWYFCENEDYIIHQPNNLYAYGFMDGYNAAANNIWDEATEYYMTEYDYDSLYEEYSDWSEY